LVARQVEVDVAQVVLARPADDDGAVVHNRLRRSLVCGRGECLVYGCWVDGARRREGMEDPMRMGLVEISRPEGYAPRRPSGRYPLQPGLLAKQAQGIDGESEIDPGRQSLWLLHCKDGPAQALRHPLEALLQHLQ